VAEPEGDNGTVSTVVKKIHRERVPQGMGSDAFLIQGGTMTASNTQVFV
jgi:hypothetical protein